MGREIQANLRHMEQVLDAFFRDNTKRADLATLGKDSQQIRGALKILGLQDAERLLGLCQDQIDTYASAETEVSIEDLELLAEALSGLGFYIEAVEQQRPERDRLIAPLLARRLGEAPKAVDADHGDTVEAAVEELRNTLPGLIAEVHRAPADERTRDVLRSKLESLRDDAELIGDQELVAQATAALGEIDTGGTASLAAAVTAIAESGSAAPAPAISEETQRLLASDATALDAELLEIFLTEAGEVLDTIAENRRMLEENHGDREALRTVRRQFHTLKGSGRMVGLNQLGEIAFEVEKVNNRLLEEERVVTPAVLAMIAVAERNFREWVALLSSSGRVVADPAELHVAIAAVEAELPAGRESVLTPTPPAPVPEIHAPLADHASGGYDARARPSAEIIELAELGSPHSGDAPLVTPLAEEEANGAELDLHAALLDHGALAPTAGISVASLAPAESPPLDDADAELPALVLPSAEPFPDARSVAVEPGAELPVAQPAEQTAAVPEQPEEITVGDVTLSAVLFGILVDEAEQHLATLAYELEVLQFDSNQRPSAAMVRASHTLCGIHRTGGFPIVATTAKALEQCLLGLQQQSPHPSAAQPVLARAVEGLRMLVERVKARVGFTHADVTEAGEIQRELEMLRQESAAEPTPADAEAQAEHDAAHDEHEARPAPALAALREPEIVVPPPAEDPLADVRDELDQDVLPIFLEEAGELFPQTGEQLRAWKRRPSDVEALSQLRRTLHTFKGSARMAGAMRLGELTHRMESRLDVGNAPGSADSRTVRCARRRFRSDRLPFRSAPRRSDQCAVAVGRGRTGGGRPRLGGARTRSTREAGVGRAVRRSAACDAGGGCAVRRSAGCREADRRRAADPGCACDGVVGSAAAGINPATCSRVGRRVRIGPARAPAGACRHDRPARERSRRGGDCPRAHRRRAPVAENQSPRTHR